MRIALLTSARFLRPSAWSNSIQGLRECNLARIYLRSSKIVQLDQLLAFYHSKLLVLIICWPKSPPDWTFEVLGATDRQTTSPNECDTSCSTVECWSWCTTNRFVPRQSSRWKSLITPLFSGCFGHSRRVACCMQLGMVSTGATRLL
jgi:hypothetical protein